MEFDREDAGINLEVGVGGEEGAMAGEGDDSAGFMSELKLRPQHDGNERRGADGRASLKDDSMLRIHILDGFLDGVHDLFVSLNAQKKNKLLPVF